MIQFNKFINGTNLVGAQPRERFEVNLAKLKAWATPPPTRATVRRFLAEIRRDGTTAP